MYGVELYAAVRLAVVDEGLSHHEAGRRFGIDRRTVKKMLSYSAPPGYRRTKPVRRPKLDGFTGIVDAILEADTDPEVPRKQRHTAHRIFERLRDEHGFSGGYTIVKDYVRSRRQSVREAFVPLHHPPGHAQVDFGEATVEVGGRREKIAFFCLILPHSNVWFVKAYPRETTEAFLDGHVSAFAFLGGVPRSILYDNTTLAVARILGDGTRRRTQAFTHLQSHYLFRDRFGRPGKGNDKGKVEALVKTARRRFMVPIPKVHDLSVLNERLMARCLERLDALEAGGQAAALLADLEALRDLPASPFEACEHVPGQISSTALIRYRLVDYSAPAAHAHKKVMVKGYVDRVEIALGAEIVARHRRSYVRGDIVYDPLHYLSLLEKKTRLVEFGRFADLNRRQRGVGKPETFDFLGLTHYCTTTRRGRFRLGRKPVAKRVNRTLARIDEVLRKRWHHDIWEVGRWLGRVCEGWLNYFAVPGSGRFIRAFHRRLQRRWMRALRRRSQRARFSWKRLERMTEFLWPRASIRHPWPDQRFAVNHPG